MAQSSRPCDGCGTDVPRMKPTGPIPPYCSDECKPRCTVADCGQAQRKRSWCASHYAQWQRTKVEPVPFLWKWGQETPRPYIPRKVRKDRPECIVEGCDKPNQSRGYCAKHVTRFRRHGDPLHVLRIVREVDEPCVVCGSLAKSIPSRFLCSKRCERLYYNHGHSVPTERTCVQCGEVTPLTHDTRSGRRRKATATLCDKCQRGSWRSKCMTVDELAERDGFLCSLCFEPVDMNLRRADSLMCPSVDHVVPRSLGGSNSPENLALAHLICNIRKNNRVA